MMSDPLANGVQGRRDMEACYGRAGQRDSQVKCRP